MKNLLGYTLFMFAALSICVVGSAAGQDPSGYTVVTAATLKKMQDSGDMILIINTLPESAYKQGHIPSSKNFEFPNSNMDTWDKSMTAGKSKDDFVSFLGEDREKPLIFYCLDEK